MPARDCKSFRKCPECQKLDREYERAVDGIYFVVNTRSESAGDKTRDLEEAQGARDRIIVALNQPRQSHSGKPSDSLAPDSATMKKPSKPYASEVEDVMFGATDYR